MSGERRLYFLDNLRTFLIFLVVLFHSGVVYAYKQAKVRPTPAFSAAE